MADLTLYPKVVGLLFDKQVDWLTDGIAVVLLASTYTYDAAHDFLDDVIADEVSGAGYTAGGQLLAGKTATLAGTTTKLDADDVDWAASTITARYAVIADVQTGVDSTSPLIGVIDFESDQSSLGSSFPIAWPSGGIITVDVT